MGHELTIIDTPTKVQLYVLFITGTLKNPTVGKHGGWRTKGHSIEKRTRCISPSGTEYWYYLTQVCMTECLRQHC